MKLLFSVFVLMFSLVCGQSEADSAWITEYDENDIIVKMSYPEIKMKNGDTETLVKWRLEAEKEIDFYKLIETIKSVPLHKDLFKNCTESKIISENDSASIVYYFFDHPWPAPNLDNVRLTKFNLDSVNSVFEYIQKSDPDLIERTDVDRININNIKYLFKKIDDKKVRIEIQEEFVAEGAPVFIIKSAFPESPVEFLERILKFSR